jgi:hypothetical protein
MPRHWFPRLVGNRQPPAYQQGVEYLAKISTFLPEPQAIDVMSNLRDRESICTWIGNSIETVNLQLQAHLNACAECFLPLDRRSIQIFAVPFAASMQLDGFCNIEIAPVTILVDVGRVAPSDWLALVAHEYAHAHLGVAGHDRVYAHILNHLCLGLGLAQPLRDRAEADLLFWPPYPPQLDPLAFWRGEVIIDRSQIAQNLI